MDIDSPQSCYYRHVLPHGAHLEVPTIVGTRVKPHSNVRIGSQYVTKYLRCTTSREMVKKRPRAVKPFVLYFERRYST